MLSILPMDDREQEEKLLSEKLSADDITESTRVLLLRDAEKTLAWAAVGLDSSVLWLLHVELLEHTPAEKQFFVDALVRAAASYGANHAAYKLACKLEALKDELLMMGFENNNGVFEILTSKIVRFC